MKYLFLVFASVLTISCFAQDESTNSQLVSAISSKAEVSSNLAVVALNEFVAVNGSEMVASNPTAVVEIVSDELIEARTGRNPQTGKPITISARTGRNPQTGRPITISAKKIVKF